MIHEMDVFLVDEMGMLSTKKEQREDMQGEKKTTK